jgi:hypothetical protein
VIEGTLEQLSEHGIFAGWLRDSDDPDPALLEIRLRGQTMARTAARAFRPDLLASGHGHGHFGFAARLLQTLPAGPATFELFLPRRGQSISVGLVVPAAAPPARAAVESLLGAVPAWRVADICAIPGALGLAAARATMGTARFVDVTFQFALNRWPSKPEATVYIHALEGLAHGGGPGPRTTEEEFLVELLNDRERADIGPAIRSPWDALYPYTAAPVRAGAAA